MFQLSKIEKAEVVANCDHLRNLKYSPNLPYAFSEYGAIMLASVLNSQRAVEASIYVVRAFVRLRELLTTHKDLAVKLDELERRIQSHDGQIQTLFEAIRQLMQPPEPPKRQTCQFIAMLWQVGFQVKEPRAKYSKRNIE